MEVLDNVKVSRRGCCFGFPKGTECQVIKVVEEPQGKMHLCYPLNKEGQQIALWHCETCLEKMEVKDAATQG